MKKGGGEILSRPLILKYRMTHYRERGKEEEGGGAVQTLQLRFTAAL